MAYNLVFYRIVYSEIEETIFYYSEINSKLGLRFKNALQSSLDDLEEKPNHFFNLEDGEHRRIVIKGFPYAFIYSIVGNEVFIKMLFPMHQDPDQLWNRVI